MFTGIVQGIAELIKIENMQGHNKFFLRIPQDHTSGLEPGASVSIDGVCLTVTSLKDGLTEFDVVTNSLSVTKLDKVLEGDWLNYERAMMAGSEVGGHILSGHIDCTGVVLDVVTTNQSFGLVIRFDPKWARFLFNKGFVGVNGASLTLSEVDKSKFEFKCWIIPETLRRTNFPSLEIGTVVNIEIDRETQVIVETISAIAEVKFASLIERLELTMMRKDFVKYENSLLIGIIDDSSAALNCAKHNVGDNTSDEA